MASRNKARPAAKAAAKPTDRSAWRLDGHVTAAAFDQGGRWLALALGSGRIRLIDLANPVSHASKDLKLQAGAMLALAADPAGGLIAGGDDGWVRRVTAEGVTDLYRQPGRWIEHLVVTPDGRIAAAAGRTVLLLAPDGNLLRKLDGHPATVQGLSQDDGLLAVAHYGGATLWNLDAPDEEPLVLEWKGSHIAAALSPDGRYLASAMSEGEIHAWRLQAEGQMRMSGYPTKVRSLSWSPDSLLLAASGAGVLTAWPFDGDGPEGRPPLELYDAGETLATLVAHHPTAPLLAAGFEDGSIVVIEMPTGRVRVGRAAVSRLPVSALVWSADGGYLVAGAEDGRALILAVAA